MATRSLAPEIRTTVENFVRDLRELLARAVIDAVSGGSNVGIEARQPALARRSAAPARAESTRAASAPRSAVAASKGAVKVHTFDDYERAAIQRALGEAHDDRLHAADLLDATKSTFYRRLRILGIRSSQEPPPLDIGRDLPLDFFAYEGRAIEAALEAAAGSKPKAAKLIGSAQSTFYRLADRHGL